MTLLAKHGSRFTTPENAAHEFCRTNWDKPRMIRDLKDTSDHTGLSCTFGVVNGTATYRAQWEGYQYGVYRLDD